MEDLQRYHLPRWEELPDIELYMDQVITLIERYLAPLLEEADEENNKIITSAMINNYVKLGIMPKPIKKRYERVLPLSSCTTSSFFKSARALCSKSL